MSNHAFDSLNPCLKEKNDFKVAKEEILSQYELMMEHKYIMNAIQEATSVEELSNIQSIMYEVDYLLKEVNMAEHGRDMSILVRITADKIRGEQLDIDLA